MGFNGATTITANSYDAGPIAVSANNGDLVVGFGTLNVTGNIIGVNSPNTLRNLNIDSGAAINMNQ